MIEPNKYYPKQMSGPIISATGEAVRQEYSEAEEIENYLYNLSIDTAQDTELDNIGRIIGYVRPLVPEGFNSENIFLFGSYPVEQDEDIGLSGVDQTIGGQLTSIEAKEINYMSTGTYRKFLKSMAILKRYGITLQSVDKIASLIADDYTISFDENNDIKLEFQEYIGFKNIWLLTQLFYRIATEPQVIISSEGE